MSRSSILVTRLPLAIVHAILVPSWEKMHDIPYILAFFILMPFFFKEHYHVTSSSFQQRKIRQGLQTSMDRKVFITLVLFRLK